MEQKDIRLNADSRKGFVKNFRQFSELKASYWREEFLKARESSKSYTKTAFKVVKDLVRRKFPQEDVDTLRKLQKRYDCMDSVANPYSCFYFCFRADLLLQRRYINARGEGSWVPR